MMQAEQATRTQNLLPLIPGAALLVLGLLTYDSETTRNAEIRAAIEADMREQLDEHVNNWEQTLQSRLDGVLGRVSDVTRSPVGGVITPASSSTGSWSTVVHDLARVERRSRDRFRWFDRMYIWYPPTNDWRPSDGRVVPAYPAPPASPGYLTADCVAKARDVEGSGPNHARQVAKLFLTGCEDESPNVRAYASSEAAQILRDADLLDEALHVLMHDGLDDRLSLSVQKSNDTMSLPIRVNRRMLLAELLLVAGNPQAGERLLRRTIEEVTELDAPRLELVLWAARGAIDKLESLGRSVTTLTSDFERAEHRMSSYRHVVEIASDVTSRYATEAPRFLDSPFGDAPHTLYVRPASSERPGVALHLRPEALIDDFVNQQVARVADDILVMDQAGRLLVGDPGLAPAQRTSVRFQASLQGLEVAFTERKVRTRVARIIDPGLSSRLLLTIFSILLGVSSLYALSRTNRRRRELLRRQRQFTQRVTHELKTPLAGIRVMAEMLSIGAFKGDAQRIDMADRIIDEADRLTSRVNEILDLSRGRVITQTQRFDIEEPVMECVEEWGPRYQQHGVRLHADLEPVDPLMGDPRAIRDAVNCLLDNALKYRRSDVDSQVWLYIREEGSSIEVEVLDNGIGVPREERTSIFERFVRVEGDNRGMAGGHGLGLSQVAEIAKAHHGTVRCEDGVDGGSRFILRLPASG